MAAITTWFTLGLFGMAVGTAVLAYGFRLIPESMYRRYAILVSVPGIAVFGYAAMALGLGSIQAAGHVVHLPRYIDWLLTTPLNILFLGLLAGASREALVRMIGLQALTIIFGFVGALFLAPLNWVFWLLGSAAFAGVVYLLYGEIDEAASETLSDSGAAVYQTLRNFVVVLWLVYPIIWVLEPSGTGLMDAETTALVVAYLDVVTKVGFGLIALHGHVVVLPHDARPAEPDIVPHPEETEEPVDAAESAAD
jgi:sensory rhodopsin